MGLYSLMTNEYNTGWLKKWLTWEPHLTLYQDGEKYLERRYVLPRNSKFNIYLHKFLKSDEDEALHDHPWNWCSIILKGSYIEWTNPTGGPGFIDDVAKLRKQGSVAFRMPEVAHRVELSPDYSKWDFDHDWFKLKPVWTLFLTGPKKRVWGFHCPKGWVEWTKFTTGPMGSVRVGCGENA